MDRIDIHIEVLRVEYDKLADGRLVEKSEGIRTSIVFQISGKDKLLPVENSPDRPGRVFRRQEVSRYR